jgi:hypothetical protein
VAAQVDAAMALPDELRRAIATRTSDPGLSAEERVQRLVDFMIADDGLALRYEEQPTYGIAESFARRKVNCLSFTLMFIALARASGMHAYAQASDDALEMRVLGDTVYRATHVNAGIEIDGLEYTVDVGWRSLLAVRKPRTITDAQLVALLHNNNAVESLLSGDKAQAATRIQAALAFDSASPTILSNAGVSGILVLVWITGLMWAGRQFAGVFVRRISPPGMLVLSAVLSALGLYAMSQASGFMLFGAATIFAFGVCFFWPTMLGTVSERFPKTGALGLAIMGGAGMLSASYIVPLVGRLFDEAIAARLPDAHTAAELAAAPTEIQAAAGLETLGKLAAIPAVLAVVFLVLYLAWRKKPAPLAATTAA